MSDQAVITEDVYREVRDFLIAEADLLDGGRFREWLGLVTDDIRYLLPVRVSRERAAPTDLTAMHHVDDDRDTLELRVRRLETEYAWAEDPPSRTRHFVTNVRVAPRDGEDELDVKSNLLLYRTRLDTPKYDLLSGERRDVLRRTEDGWRIAARTVILDQSVVLTHNLAVIL